MDLILEVKGPPEAPYEGVTYKLKLIIPVGYPFKVPEVTVLTRIYHPLINRVGKICLIELEEWSPAYTIEKIGLFFIEMLNHTKPGRIGFVENLKKFSDLE